MAENDFLIVRVGGVVEPARRPGVPVLTPTPGTESPVWRSRPRKAADDF